MSDPIEGALLDLARLRLAAEMPAQVVECLGALDERDIWWRPSERTNAVGNLVLHLAGSNRHFICHVIGGQPFRRDRDAEFAERTERSKTELLALWNDTTAAVAPVLDALTFTRLAETTTDKGRSVLQVLLHVTHHNALHLGQIVWITKMRRPGALNELLRTPVPAR
jgi:uncharacterized damage-inducible protein DinB